MPRKTDGMLIELQPGPKKGDDGKPLLYARPAKGLKRTIHHIDELCAKYRGMLRGDMERHFDTFIDVIRQYLADGYRIETPLGTFAPKVKLLGEHTDPAKVRGIDVKFCGIEFTPSKAFVKEVERRQKGFRVSDEPVGNEQMHDPQTMETALRNSMRNGYITIGRFQVFSKLKYNSAKRYLDRLCQGDDAPYYRYREGRTWHYAPRKK
jgi:hypothetical protein